MALFNTTNSQDSKKYSDIFVLILFFFAAFILYFKSVYTNYFVFDDILTIKLNNFITNPLDFKTLWGAFNTRFIVGFSFALNYCLSRLDPSGYKLVNLVIHIFNAFFVYRFMQLTFSLPQLQRQYKGASEILPVFVSLIFLIHPIQTEAVNFITQRFVLLASFFYILSLTYYVRARIDANNSMLAKSILAAVAAMFCKEFTVTLPIMIIMYEFYFLNFLKTNLARRVLLLIPFLLILAIIPVTLLKTTVNTFGVARIVNVSPQSTNTDDGVKNKIDITRAGGVQISRLEYFLTELNVLRTYLRLLFIPINQNFDYDYPIYNNSQKFHTILSFTVLILLLLMALLTFNSNRLISFSILWFFVVSSVESSIIPIAHVISEYRVYLPSLGIIIFFCISLFHLIKNAKAYGLCIILLTLILCVLTFQRNLIWSDEIRLWKDTLQKSPLKSRVYCSLGSAYLDRGDLENGEFYLRQTLQLDKNDAQAYFALSIVESKKGDLKKALDLSQKAIELNPWENRYWRQVGYINLKLQDFNKAVYFYKQSFINQPTQENASEFLKVLFYSYQQDKNKEAILKEAAVLKEYNFGQLADEAGRLINEMERLK